MTLALSMLIMFVMAAALIALFFGVNVFEVAWKRISPVVTPPQVSQTPQHTEDDPTFMAHVTRRAGHREPGR